MNTLSAPPINHQSLNNYNDLHALESIKYSKADKEARLDAVAKQFESLFVSMMIKSMRDANKVFAEGNMLQSNETEHYQQMFDSQLAVSMSTGKGIGLADVIKRQLTPSVGPHRAEGLNTAARAEPSFSMDGYERKFFPSRAAAERMVEALQTVERIVDESIDAEQTTSQDVSQVAADKLRALDFSSPDKFIESLYPYAKSVEAETGVDARLMLAQSALETGWGKHQIMKADGSPSHNLFGIKAQHNWQGDEAEILTTEYREGVAMKERASFRAYPSYAESFKDYANFLQSNDRYQPAFDHLSDPKAFAHALQASGYATDPNYGAKISSILDRYLLSDLDPAMAESTAAGHSENQSVVR